MTEKELRRLRRQDLMQLLLTQLRESEWLRAALTERENSASELRQTLEKLKTRLDGKDETIRLLREQILKKDAVIERLVGLEESAWRERSNEEQSPTDMRGGI